MKELEEQKEEEKIEKLENFEDEEYSSIDDDINWDEVADQYDHTMTHNDNNHHDKPSTFGLQTVITHTYDHPTQQPKT